MKRKTDRSSSLERALPESLREQIFTRDSWRCQLCGSMQNLQIHHQRFRSHGGGDAEDNLIVLCAACHSRVHGSG